jgi:hypothetical protein
MMRMLYMCIASLFSLPAVVYETVGTYANASSCLPRDARGSPAGRGVSFHDHEA